MTESILQEADNLTNHDRQDDYGHPYDDFSKTGKMWEGIFGHKVTPQQVALCMVCVKISRECNKPKRDNSVDGAGYFNCLDMVNQRQAEMDAGHDAEIKKIEKRFDEKFSGLTQ